MTSLKATESADAGLADASRRHSWVSSVAFCYLTSVFVWAGVWFGVDFTSQGQNRGGNERTFLGAFANWDGVWYARIARDGYQYDPAARSNVAFFPAYPLAGRFVAWISGLNSEIALLVVSHACLCGIFVLGGAYVQTRETPCAPELREWTLLAFGLWPVTFFFRMAYSESLFVFVVVLFLFAMQRRWWAVTIALLVGLATACRPVGVALCPVFAWHLWTERRSLPAFALGSAVLLPISLWGLVGYMLFQASAFGEPLAFSKTQEHWAALPAVPWPERLWRTAVLEPIWSKYNPYSPSWWARPEPEANPLFSLEFANPLYFLAIVGLVSYGAYRRWLNMREIMLAAFLLFIPYVLQGHRNMMGAQARFSSVAFPAYIVMGHLLARMPTPLAALLLAGAAFLMGTYAALFAAGHRFF